MLDVCVKHMTKQDNRSHLASKAHTLLRERLSKSGGRLRLASSDSRQYYFYEYYANERYAHILKSFEKSLTRAGFSFYWLVDSIWDYALAHLEFPISDWGLLREVQDVKSEQLLQ